jgi:hypothetical protein
MTPLVLMALTACAQGHVATLTPHGLLQLDVDSLDLGATPLDVRGEGTLTLGNAGETVLTVSLALTEPAGPWSLAQTSARLAPGEHLDLTVWFEPPGDRDSHTDTLVLTPDDGEPVSVALSGTTDPDGDSDGHEHLALGGDDCDDTRGDVSPSATETWYDDLDQDCDGLSDHDADLDDWDAEPQGRDCDDQDPEVRPGAAELWYDDVDQDCDNASDHDADLDGVDAEPVGDDCDDDDVLVHPGAKEVWYDGTDQDCSGASDLDADGDGVDAEGFGGTDCDDSDADVYPSAPEADDLQDSDCDTLVDEDFLVAGDLVLSEVLVDPAASYDHYGQFVEVTNVSARVVDLSGWTLVSDAGDLELATQAVLPAGDRLVLCVSDDRVVNGDLVCDGTWDGTTLASPDSLTLAAGVLTLDQVAWTPLWPVDEGSSMSLSPDSVEATANDDRAAWCSASSAMASGDLGTPGAVNDVCP